MARGRKATAGEKTGHRKAAVDAEPLSVSLAPVADGLALCAPPEDLGEVGSDVWRTTLAGMTANRNVREEDLVHLRAYCEWVEIRETAWESVRKGLKVKIDGKVKRNPDLITMKEADTQARYWADILGITPLARIRQGLAELAGQSMVLDIRDRLVADITKGR